MAAKVTWQSRAAVRNPGWLDEIDDPDSKGTPDAAGMAAATRLLASMMAGSASEHGGQVDNDKR